MIVIDRRSIAIGGQSKRSLSQIKNIAIHYSATKIGNSAVFEQYWSQSRGWKTGGYHEVILLNGDVELNYNPTVITNGVKNYNISTYHICYVGDGKPNGLQMVSLRKRIKRAKQLFHIKREHIKGHREFRGAKTACPALNVKKEIIAKLNSVGMTSTEKTTTTKAKTGPIATIQNWVNTYSFNYIKVDNLYGPKTHRALVKVYQYELNVQFNRNLVVDGIPGPKTDAAVVIIRKGARGNLTKVMQAFLYVKGYPLAVDGIFGDITHEMIKIFQRKNKLKVDGIAGKATFRKLIRR